MPSLGQQAIKTHRTRRRVPWAGPCSQGRLVQLFSVLQRLAYSSEWGLAAHVLQPALTQSSFAVSKLRFQSEYRAFFFLHEGCHGLLNVSGFTTITTIRLRCIKAPNPGLLQLSSVSVLCINQEDFGGYFARLFCSLSAQSGCFLVSAALGMWRNRKSFGDAKYKAAVEAFQAVPYQTQPPGCCRYHSCSSSLCQRQNRVPLSPDMRQSPHQAAAQGTPWALYCSPWASVQQQ